MILDVFSLPAFPFQSTSDLPSLDPIRMMHVFLEEYSDWRGEVRFPQEI